MNEIVARALVDLVASIELTSDDELDPDLAAAWLDDVATALEDLSDPDRHDLVRLISELARTTRDENRRDVLVDLPDDLGLIEEG
jgi:hypothetical protein